MCVAESDHIHMERPAAIVLPPVLVIIVIQGDPLAIQRGEMASPVLQVERACLRWL